MVSGLTTVSKEKNQGVKTNLKERHILIFFGFHEEAIRENLDLPLK
jgi:hypothetical protein